MKQDVVIQNSNQISENCCGCGACLAVCPVKGIKIIEKERGALYYIQNENCIHCNKCRLICPMQNDKDLFHRKNESFYQAKTNNIEVLKKSSSGGIAYEVASYFLQCVGGIVYGAGWDYRCQQVQHQRVVEIADLHILQGSKYVHSAISPDIYHNILRDVQNRKVLFLGTPCQVASVRKYVKDSPNLFSIDLICHGVPSAKLLSEQLVHITRNKISNISFRQGINFILSCSDEKGSVFCVDGLDNPYYSLFLRFASLRESCYSCKYACQERVGDISLGDFVENGIGYSCVIPNTKEGEILLNKLVMVSKEIKPIDLLRDNHAFNMPTQKHPRTEFFTRLYKKYGLIKSYKISFLDIIFKRKIKKLLLLLR